MKKKKKSLFVVSSSLLTSCLFGNKCKEFHYTRWHLFRINLRFVWGRLPINRARTSSLNPSRPLCSESRKLFFSFFKLASLTHAAEERTDSHCHKALTWAGKQTGTSADSVETTWIKSSVSLSLSDQNYHSRAALPTCRCQDEWHIKVRD